MYFVGYICLLVALLGAFCGAGLALLQLMEKRATLLKVIKWLQWPINLSLLMAAALLLHALFWNDYRLEYVVSYTDSLLPAFYRLTAFWAGQPGSMLFWALAASIAGATFSIVPSARKLSPVTSLWFYCFFYINIAFFCLLLTSWSNPFIMLQPAPLDGAGLNPLLQNPGMIIHPPLLFMGYALFTIPACLALAHLLNPAETEIAWSRLSRPFILLAWLLLTAGIMLGAWWAYMELGWGGYWGWDPVENASLLPWLCATAALHSLAVNHASGKLERASVLLMALTVISAFFATWLTRSGVIQSVHAFGDGGVGAPLLVFVLGSLFIALLITATAPKTGAPLAALFSREGALVLTAWLFLAFALIVLMGTMWPVFSGLSGGLAQGLDASFYNRACLPLGAMLLLLLCFCTFLGQNGGFSGGGSVRKFFAVCGALVASACALWMTGYRQPLSLFAASAAIAALAAMGMHCLDRRLRTSGRFRSSLGAHFGIAILAIGIAFSSSYSITEEFFLSKGQKENIGPYSITLMNVLEGEGAGYAWIRADLSVRADGAEKGVVAPERRIYAKFGDMQFSEVDVISTLGEDVYASLLGLDEEHRALVRISIEPLVNWIWIGAFVMCLLPLTGLRGGKRHADSGKR